MEVYRLGIKLFVADPALVSLRDFIPVFHTWIQRQCVENHLLVDIHDYSHIHRGPGILLVAHEGNFSMDQGHGRLGLFYYRKQPLDGPPEDGLAAILKSALQGCCLLENEPSLAGQIRFRTDELLIVANDRLHAPNDERTLSELRPVISAVLTRLLGVADFTLTPISGNPKERFTVRVQTGRSEGTKTLLERLSSRS